MHRAVSVHATPPFAGHRHVIAWVCTRPRRHLPLVQEKGEYGISQVLLDAGYNLATLMARYAPGVDWRDRVHWHCNNNTHPSRHGTYDHISMHPFETMFIKARRVPHAMGLP